MRAFNQAGQIGRRQTYGLPISPTVCPDCCQRKPRRDSLERRKRIIRNFGMRRGNARDQRGFTGVRESNKAYIGQQFLARNASVVPAQLAFFRFARA